jgi:sialate O-acetylesterase
VAQDPLAFFPGAIDPVHNPDPLTDKNEILREKKMAVKGVGPGLAFGREMIRLTGVPQGLIECAHGATSMDQWSSALKEEGGRSLYGAMLRRFRKLSQPVAGVLWYQGESDCGSKEAPFYTGKMVNLVQEVRKDFGQPDMPWVMVQLGRVFGVRWDQKNWQSVREQQRCLPSKVARLDVVPAIDLELDDEIHIGAAGHKILGKRLARAACRLLAAGNVKHGGIQLRSVRLGQRDTDTSLAEIEVSFDNVDGALMACGLANGFSLLDSDGQNTHGIYKTRLCGATVRLEHIFGNEIKNGKYFLAYGLGLGAYCNIHDEQDMGLPACGPLAIEQ